MTGSDFDYDAHERLRCRTANKMDSVLWTCKAHFKAADWYSTWSSRLDWGTTFGAAVLTFGLIWNEFPQHLLIGLAIFTAVLSGYKTASKPQKKAEDHYTAADAYHRLLDEFRDYVKFELADEHRDLEEMKESFNQLSQRRRTLNEDTPHMTSKWYDKLDDSIYDQIETTEEAKERLTGVANLQRENQEQK